LASIELLKDLLVQEGITIGYKRPRNLLSSIEHDVIDMEGQLRAGWLLTLKAAWLMDERRPNTIEASTCKVKAGDVVTRVTQKAVELMGR
jgi:acyl-CoA dehydrogenase